MECPRIAQKRTQVSRSLLPGGGTAHFSWRAGKVSGDAPPKNLVGIEATAIYYSKPGGKMEIPVLIW